MKKLLFIFMTLLVISCSQNNRAVITTDNQDSTSVDTTNNQDSTSVDTLTSDSINELVVGE